MVNIPNTLAGLPVEREWFRAADLVARGVFSTSDALYWAVRQGKFPPGVQIGTRAVAWPKADILEYEATKLREREARIAARQQAEAA